MRSVQEPCVERSAPAQPDTNPNLKCLSACVIMSINTDLNPGGISGAQESSFDWLFRRSHRIVLVPLLGYRRLNPNPKSCMHLNQGSTLPSSYSTLAHR